MRPRTLTEVESSARRPEQSVSETLAWCIGCFTTRHVASDRERQQAAIRRASLMVSCLEQQHLCQLVELLGLIIDAMTHGIGGVTLTSGLCALLEAMKGMPRLRFTGRWSQFGDDVGALASAMAPLLLSPEASIEQAAFDALFALISTVRADDHRADPPPRTPTPSSVTALERPALLNAIVEGLACSTVLSRQSHPCELLLLLCRASAPSCALACAAGAESVVLRMLQEVGDTSRVWSGGRDLLQPARGEEPSASWEPSSSQRHGAVGDIGVPPRLGSTRRLSLDVLLADYCSAGDSSLRHRTRPFSAGDTLRAQPVADDSDDQIDSPPGTPTSRRRRVQSAAPRSSELRSAADARELARTTQPVLVGSRQLAAGERGRLLFRCIELLSILLDQAPEAAMPQLASAAGAAALLPLVQSSLRAADTNDERRLKNDMLLMLNQIASSPAGPDALMRGGVLGVLMNGLLAALAPELAADGAPGGRSSRALRLCSGFGVDDFESCMMTLGIFRRCISASAACAAAAVASGLHTGMCKLLSAEAWATSRELRGWKADQRSALRLAGLELVREVVSQPRDKLDEPHTAALAAGPRLEASADLLSLCADEAAGAAIGEPAPLLLVSLETLAAIATDPSGETSARLRLLGAVDVLAQLVCAGGGGVSAGVASGLALQALAAIAEADAASAEAVFVQGLVPLLIASLAPVSDGNVGGDVLLRMGTHAWTMMQRMELLASLSAAADPGLLEGLAAQVAETGGMLVVIEMLCLWPPALLWPGFSLLAEWTREPRILRDLLTATIAVPHGSAICQPGDPMCLPALSVLLRLWASAEQPPSLGALRAPGESTGRDAVARAPALGAATELLGWTDREEERPSEVLGKLYSLVVRAERSDLPLPPLSERDETLLTAARAYASVKEGRAWSKLAVSLDEEGLQPVAADVRRMAEAVEASGRAVDTSWAVQREQWGAIRERSEQDEKGTYERALGRVSMTKPAGSVERARSMKPAHGVTSFEQKQRGKAFKAAMNKRPSLVVPDGGWVIEDEL